MKKFISVILCLLTVTGMFACTLVTASAANTPELSMEEKYDEDAKTLTVTITLKNAVGATSGVVDLVFDDEMCSYRKKDGFKSLTNAVTIEGGKTVDNTYECACAFMAADSVTAEDCDENGNLLLCEFKFDVKGEYKQNAFYLYSDDGIAINNSNKTIEPVGNTDMAPVKNTTANKAAKNNNSSSKKPDTKDSNTVLFVIIAVAVLAAAAAVTVAVSKKKKAQEENGETEIAEKSEVKNIEEKSEVKNIEEKSEVKSIEEKTEVKEENTKASEDNDEKEE